MAAFTFDLLNEKGTPVIYSLGQSAGDGQSLTLTVKSPATAWQPGAGEPSLANCHFAICFQSGLLFTDAVGGDAVPTLNSPETSSTGEWLISGLLTHPDDGSDCFCVLWQGSEADPGAEHSFQLSGITVEDGMITQHVRTLLRIGTVGENGQPLFDTTPAQTIVQQLLTVEEDYPYDLSDIGTVSDTIDQKIEAFRNSDHGFLTSADLPQFITDHTSSLQSQVDQIETDADDLEKKLMAKITALDAHEDHQVDLILGGMGETDTLMTVLRDKAIPPLQARIMEGSAGWNFLQVGGKSTIVIQIFPNPDFFNLHTQPGSAQNPPKIKAKAGSTVAFDLTNFKNFSIDSIESPSSKSWIINTAKNIATLSTSNSDERDILTIANPLKLTISLEPKDTANLYLVPLIVSCGNFTYQKMKKGASTKLPRPDLTLEPTPVLAPVSATSSSLYSYTEESIGTLALHIPLYLGPLKVSPGLLEVGNASTGGAAKMGIHGDVGIGTSTPLDMLHFQGKLPYILFEDFDKTSGGAVPHLWRLGLYGQKQRFQILETDYNTPRLVIKEGGNVGIGSDAPSQKLTIQTETQKYGLLHTDGTISVGTFVGGSNGGASMGTKSNHPFSLFVNDGSASLTVKTDGNVVVNNNLGIGTTTTPRSQLEIRKDKSGELGPRITLHNESGGAGAGGAIDFNGTGYGLNLFPEATTLRLQSLNDGVDSSHLVIKTRPPGQITYPVVERFRITSEGKVSIGGTESTELKAALSVKFDTGNSTMLQLGRKNVAILGGNSQGNLHIESGTPPVDQNNIDNINGIWNGGTLYLNHYSKKPTIIGGDLRVAAEKKIKIGSTEISENDLKILKNLVDSKLEVELINTDHDESLFASNVVTDFKRDSYRMVATWMTKTHNLTNGKWKLILR